MTINKNLKKRVRARMERTGEKYTRALFCIERGIPEPMSDAQVVAEYGESLGVEIGPRQGVEQ